MLSHEDNQILCNVEGDAPMGKVFRAVWLPAVPANQLPRPGCPPIRIRLLGEDLVAFRGKNGKPGIIDAYCAHRRAPLFYGKVEENGIRCAYHGWKFGCDGQCHEIPSDASGKIHKNITLKSYPVREHADVIWVYMGSDEPPALPGFPWMDLPESQRLTSVWLQESNWLQGAEGEIDSSHVSVLHKSKALVKPSNLIHRKWTFLDPAPKFDIKPTDIGYIFSARRQAEGGYYWRLTQWMAPMFSFIPSAVWPIGGRAWVPIDNSNTYTWDFSFSKQEPIRADYQRSFDDGVAFPPKLEYKSYKLNTGAIIDTWIPLHNARNNYEIDRRLQAEEGETTGIFGINDQDRAVQEGMKSYSQPGLVDRSEENLVGGDINIVRARRYLLDLVKNPQRLDAFREAIRSGHVYNKLPIDEVHEEGDLDAFLAEMTEF